MRDSKNSFFLKIEHFTKMNIQSGSTTFSLTLLADIHKNTV